MRKMNLSSPFCHYRGFKMSLTRVQGHLPYSCIYKRAKVSAVTLSQTAPKKVCPVVCDFSVWSKQALILIWSVHILLVTAEFFCFFEDS